MCGRYSLLTEPYDIVRLLWPKGIHGYSVDSEPRAQIRPTETAPVLHTADGTTCLGWVKWGVKPQWSKRLLINAKAETLTADRRSFWQHRKWSRCLVPVDAFYDWREVPGQKRKQPMAFTVVDQQAFTLGGLSRSWQLEDGTWMQHYVILTTEPNELIAPIHNRMPVIIRPEHRERWMLGDLSREQVAEMCRPYPAEQMTGVDVDL